MRELYDKLLRETFEGIVNPEEFMLATHGAETMAAVNEEMRVTRRSTAGLAPYPEMAAMVSRAAMRIAQRIPTAGSRMMLASTDGQ